MSSDTKLDFSDWQLVRDTVARTLSETRTLNDLFKTSVISQDSVRAAERLLKAGFIDIDAILLEARGENLGFSTDRASRLDETAALDKAWDEYMTGHKLMSPSSAPMTTNAIFTDGFLAGYRA
jgi:hypothetical protein